MRGGQPYHAAASAIVACLAALAASACGGSTQTQVIGPSGVRCATTVSPDSTALPAEGGRVTLTVSVARDCSWSAHAEASWLQLSATAGQGPATVVVTASPNRNLSSRTAGIAVNDQQLILTQEARTCPFELRPRFVQMDHQGGRGSISITTVDGCQWRASTPASWVSVSDEQHSGSGVLHFDVAPNDGAVREATVALADEVFTITQGGPGSPPPPGPTDPNAPPPPSGLTATVVSDTRVDLSWTNADPAAETQVYRDGEMVATKGAGATSHQDTGLTRATSYTYAVRHVRNGVAGASSNSVVGRPVFHATGGNVSTDGGYRQHLFTSSGSFVVTQGGTIDEIIIIGGGGGGGGSEAGTEWGSGGGGAGGVRVITMRTESPGTYAVVVGAGGAGGRSRSSHPGENNGLRGQPSSYAGEEALGGGSGAGAGSSFFANPGNPGGSGGGGVGTVGGAGIPGQGSSGGAGFGTRGGAAGGGGGGGRGGAGSAASGGHGGSGGAGYSTWIGVVAAGGRGGRGTGGHGASGAATGNGGDGNDSGGEGGSGANGAVLIRYRQ